MRRLIGRAALAVWCLLAGVVLLEAVLQLAAVVVVATGREIQRSWLTGNTRILCLGDSNTYGLYLERDQAYPQQLEAIWNAFPDANPVEALNLGFPGMNSSRLLRDFERMLVTFQPDLVIVMIGANDFWTSPVPLESEPRRTSVRSFLVRYSRVWKLYQILRRAGDSSELEVTFDPPVAREAPASGMDGDETATRQQQSGSARFGSAEFALGFIAARPGELERATVQLEDNLGTLAELARAFGCRLVMMTYPSRFQPVYHAANRVIVRAALRSGTELVDLEKTFKHFCRKEKCPEFLFPDNHPRARGHQVVANTLVEYLRGSPPPRAS